MSDLRHSPARAPECENGSAGVRRETRPDRRFGLHMTGASRQLAHRASRRLAPLSHKAAVTRSSCSFSILTPARAWPGRHAGRRSRAGAKGWLADPPAADTAELSLSGFAYAVRGCVAQHSARTILIDGLKGYQMAISDAQCPPRHIGVSHPRREAHRTVRPRLDAMRARFARFHPRPAGDSSCIGWSPDSPRPNSPSAVSPFRPASGQGREIRCQSGGVNSNG
jgi:hypothetical protein